MYTAIQCILQKHTSRVQCKCMLSLPQLEGWGRWFDVSPMLVGSDQNHVLPIVEEGYADLAS